VILRLPCAINPVQFDFFLSTDAQKRDGVAMGNRMTLAGQDKQVPRYGEQDAEKVETTHTGVSIDQWQCFITYLNSIKKATR
jgi:hypothetical protein